MADNDLISRSALKRYIQENGMVHANRLDEFPAVDAVPVEALGKWGKLLIPYKGCPRGHTGRVGAPVTIEEEALHWGVITDVDGGRWVPIAEEVLRELIANASAVDSVEVGACEGCYWKEIGRQQKCSCCRRNRYMKDNYRRVEDG